MLKYWRFTWAMVCFHSVTVTGIVGTASVRGGGGSEMRFDNLCRGYWLKVGDVGGKPGDPRLLALDERREWHDCEEPM